MRAMFSLHVEYLLNRRTVAIMILSSLILAGFYIYYGDLGLDHGILDSDRELTAAVYLSDIVFLLEFFLLVMALGIAQQGFSRSGSGYLVYLVDSRRSKLAAIASRIMAVFFCEVAFVFGQFFSFYLLSRTLSPYAFSFIKIGSIFLRLALMMGFFSLFQGVLLVFVDNNLTFMLPTVLYWYLSQHDTRSAIADNQALRVLNTIIPNLIEHHGDYLYFREDYGYIVSASIIAVILLLLSLGKDF